MNRHFWISSSAQDGPLGPGGGRVWRGWRIVGGLGPNVDVDTMRRFGFHNGFILQQLIPRKIYIMTPCTFTALGFVTPNFKTIKNDQKEK